MKRIPLLVLLALAAAAVSAQNLRDDLAALVEIPAVTGYEHALAEKIRALAKPHLLASDNLGNLWVTLGSGAPHRLLVAPMDEPGYVVSGVTGDGYLRVQRLPQGAPYALFDQLHAAQPVLIHTRKGQWVSGVVAGLSTHLQGARRDTPRTNHPDELYVDIGASTAAEVKQAGVDVLDPIALERTLYRLANNKVTAMAVGDRFGAAALLQVLRRADPGKVQGTLTIAFAAQQWASSRGLDRLLQHIKADEMTYVGRLLPRRAGLGGAGAGGATGGAGQGQQQRREGARPPQREPGGGAVLGVTDAEAAPAGLPAVWMKTAEEKNLKLSGAASAPLPRVSYTRGPVLPQQFAHLGIATVWASTPAETLDLSDLESLVALLSTSPGSPGAVAPAEALPAPELPRRPATAPATTAVLKTLVESYGMSGHEQRVQEAISALLPPWAKPETDSGGNLIVRINSRKAGSKTPGITFVAHSDEIGYQVESITDDGRLLVRSRGGGTIYFFAGHAMFVHTPAGIRPGVMELPSNWDQPDFEWPRGGPQAGEGGLRVDVGARSREEVARLGVEVGQSITVPKKYRPLYGRRANGRSFDDRIGCAALVAAAWALGPNLVDRDVTFIWATREEVGLLGALDAARDAAAAGRAPDYVFAVDTFVSSDSPLESKRFADAPIGRGFVIRAVDNSNITARAYVDKLIALARAHAIPVQSGVTGGGNDGAAFLRHGSVDIPISWPLRYSHSPGEVVDMRDVEALARIVAAIARFW